MSHCKRFINPLHQVPITLPYLAAQIRLRRLAELALTALRNVQRDDVIARLHTGDALANTLDNTATLMAEHYREEALRIVTVECVRVGVAHAREEHFYAHLVRLWQRHFDCLDRERLLRLPGDGSTASDHFALGVRHCRSSVLSEKVKRFKEVNCLMSLSSELDLNARSARYAGHDRTQEEVLHKGIVVLARELRRDFR